VFFLEPEVPGSSPDLVYSASDLVVAASCEYQLLRKLDEKLGRSPLATFEDDEMLKHAAVLGDLHERTVLGGFVAEFGDWDPATGHGVYDVDLWPVGFDLCGTFPVVVPPGARQGRYDVRVAVAYDTVVPNFHLRDILYNRDHYSGEACGSLSVVGKLTGAAP